ncbi:MAG: hypothetical protein IT443_07105 [Phycisphaeraceae bacterium]|nr:hypothetical protein [Phycisphaeraceae bacterium]
MLKSTPEWEAFEREQIRKEPADYHRNAQMFEAMYDWACTMNAFPLADPLDGLDKDIQLAKDLDSLPRPSAG